MNPDRITDNKKARKTYVSQALNVEADASSRGGKIRTCDLLVPNQAR